VARKARIVIIGAGIGGLAAAAALRQRGFEVALHERATALGEVGAGLQLGPNAVKVLRGLGLEEAMRRTACEPVNWVSLKWDDASLRFRQPLLGGEYGAPYLTAHRADLHAALRSLVPDGVVHLGVRCVGVAHVAGGAAARFADGTEVEGDIVIGADGVRSAVREALFGADVPRFTGQVCWRAMLPIEAVPTDLGPGGSVRVERHEYVGWLGPTGHVICYPIRAGRVYNIFAGRVAQDWTGEGWSAPSTREAMLAGYEGWNEALLGMFRIASDVFKWGIHDRDPLPSWVQGRIALLGDAAHPMMPTLAQGAAISLEDGAALARNLAQHADLDTGLAAYDRERAPRAGRVQLQARTQFENNRKVPAPPPTDRGWIFAHDATTGTATEAAAA
jgi:salicylate hydroxylase